MKMTNVARRISLRISLQKAGQAEKSNMLPVEIGARQFDFSGALAFGSCPDGCDHCADLRLERTKG
jgi:hypothetical protein